MFMNFSFVLCVAWILEWVLEANPAVYAGS